MCVYGDPVYPYRVQLQGPFRNGAITERVQEYNRQISAFRVSVERLFGDLINTFHNTSSYFNLHSPSLETYFTGAQ